MGVEVVQDHPDRLRFGVVLLHQGLHLMGEVFFGAPIRHLDVTPPCVRFEEHEQVARAAPAVLVVVALRLARLHWHRDVLLLYELVGHLIKANLRALGVVILGIEVQDILHAPDKLCAHAGDAPLLPSPRLQSPLLSVRLTVSSLRESTTSSSTSLSARSCIVQCLLPCGGSLEAKAKR